jgi:hypothetical protein
LPIITKLKTWKVKQNYVTTSGRKKLAKSKLIDMEMTEIIYESDILFPKMKQALQIL